MMNSIHFDSKKPLISTLLLIWVLNLYSQENHEHINRRNKENFKLIKSDKIDSIAPELHLVLKMSKSSKDKNETAGAHLNLGQYYYKIIKNDSSLIHLSFALLLYKETQDHIGLAYVYRFLSRLYTTRFDSFVKAREYLAKSSEQFKIMNEPLPLARNKQILSGIYMEENNLSEAIKWANHGNQDFLTHGDSTAIRYMNVSTIYAKMKIFDMAEEYLNKHLEIVKTDSSQLSEVYNQFGTLYCRQMRLDTAQYYFKKGDMLGKLSGNVMVQAAAKINLAEINLHLKNYTKALLILQEAKKINTSERIKLHFNRIISRTHLAQNHLDSALFYSKKMYNVTGIKELFDLRKSSLKDLSITFERMKMYDSALFYHKLYEKVNDSLQSEKMGKQFANQRIIFETQENENEIIILNQEKIFNKRLNYAFSIIIVLLILISMLIFRTLKERFQKKHEKLELDKQILEQQIEHKKTELFDFTLSMINKNNRLLEVENEMKSSIVQMNGSITTNKVLKSISLGRSSEKDWENFNKYFGAVHNDFFNTLKSNYPSLTNYELRLCALIRIHLTHKEISDILGIESKSVKMACYRLKKKFELTEAQKLSDFVSVQ